MKKILIAAALLLVLLCGCALADTTVINLSDSMMAVPAGVIVEGSKVIISEPGDYLLSGSFNGQISVECAKSGKVTLQLNGVEITNNDGPAIYIRKASPRAVISLTENTVNKLTSGENYVMEDAKDPSGVIFSRSDLTITGSGALEIVAGTLDGIASKDDLRIKGGVITVKAARHGIRGKDAVEIENGTLTIIAAKDGIRSTSTASDAGYIAITGGSITIQCGDEPLSAQSRITVSGAELSVTLLGD